MGLPGRALRRSGGWGRGSERRPGSAEAAICASGGSARIYQSAPRREALKGTGACGAEGVSTEGAGLCRGVWARPHSRKSPPPPLPGKGDSCPLEGFDAPPRPEEGQPSRRGRAPSLTLPTTGSRWKVPTTRLRSFQTQPHMLPRGSGRKAGD